MIHILLIEDNIIEISFFEHLLENRSDIKLTYFQNGKDGLQFLKNHYKNINMVFVDINMPEMDGLEFIQEVRDLNICIPILILSTSNQKKDVNDAYKFGANSYIVKPIELNYFNEILIQIINYWTKINQSYCN